MTDTLRKALLALLVGVGMMGAVGIAQAQEKVWERVSDIYGHWSDSPKGSIDEMCLFSIEVTRRANGYRYEVFYTGTYEIRQNTSPPIRCFVTTKPPWISGVSVSPTCKEGGVWSRERPDGCYKLVDNCPKGTVNEGGVCVEECPEGQTWDGEECLPKCTEGQSRQADKTCACIDGELINGKCIPVNDEQCDQKDYTATEAGGVSCNGDNYSICVWKDRLAAQGYNSDEVYACAIAHEKAHIEHAARVMNQEKYTCNRNRLSVTGEHSREVPLELAITEAWARSVERICLQEKRENCQSDNCRNEIERRDREIVREMAIFGQQYYFYSR